MTATQFTIMLCISGAIVIWLMFLTFGYLDLKRDAEIDNSRFNSRVRKANSDYKNLKG